MRNLLASLILATSSMAALPARAAIPASFEIAGADRAAMQALLDSYTRAVSGKDRPCSSPCS